MREMWELFHNPLKTRAGKPKQEESVLKKG